MQWSLRMGLGMMLLLGGAMAWAGPEGGGLDGDWVSPTGSIVRVAGCGNEVCLTIVTVEASAPVAVDENNPDKALRGRSLCGLEIGRGFRRDDPTHASGGTVYDPKSGKTYSGTMVVDGNKLKLRGFIGVALFGRTETWKRAQGMATACRA